MDFFNTAVLGSMSLYDAMAYFLLYSFLGWCSEVVYVAAASGKLVNRGFLNGPVCPIYGFGVVAVLWLLHPLEDNLLLLFSLAALWPAPWSWWAAGHCSSCTTPAGGTTPSAPLTLGAISACNTP